MLLIPFDRKIDWSHPPIITLLLVLINVVVYFTFQGNEDQNIESAYSYYTDSGLAEIEYPAFQKFLKKHKEKESFNQANMGGWFQLISHLEFNQQLQAGKIIFSSEINTHDWKRKRQEFEEIMGKIATFEYGYKTGDPGVVTALTHMFLHGGVGHLLGNMFFLFVVGFLVEATLGKSAYLSLYLLCGFGSVLLYQMFAPASLIPGIGASGAISGVMGMYTVLYWLRPIRFFYFIFVYFNTIRLPAIVLLPFWVGTEVFQLIQYPESNVNYLAHIGGFLSGAVLAAGAKQFLPSYDMSFYEEKNQENTFKATLAEAESLCQQMKYREALPLLKKLELEQADQPAVLYRLQQCSRMKSDSKDYHDYSRKVFLLHGQDETIHKNVREAYRHYIKNARPSPRLNQHIILVLVKRFILHRDMKEAEFLASLLIKNKLVNTEALDVIERLSNILVKTGESKKGVLFRDKARQLYSQ